MPHPGSAVDRQIHGDWILPFEIMSIIMAECSWHRRTISALMKSCRALYSEGPKYLLRDGVEVGSRQTMIPFANFMLTEDPSRFAHWRKLVLSNKLCLGALATAGLVEVLTHPSLVLESLVVRYGGTLSSYDPEIRSFREAVGKLKTIKHLAVVREVSFEIIDITKCLPSKLESVSVGAYCEPINPRHILAALKPFASTLHTLLIHSLPRIPPPSSEGSAELLCEFPRVQTFGVVCSNARSVLSLLVSPTFAQAFPNLNITDLKLLPTKSRTERWQLDRAIRLRERVRALRFRVGYDTMAALSSVKKCSGRLYDVAQPVDTAPLETVPADDFPVLRTLLEDTCLQHLFLGIESGDDIEPLSAILRALPDHSPSRIDLSVSGFFFYYSHGQAQLDRVRSGLVEPFCQLLPAGLVELNILLNVNAAYPHSAHKTVMVDDVCVKLQEWAETAIPSLRLTLMWSVTYRGGEEWEWPDLGQDDEDTWEFESHDDLEDEYEYDSDSESYSGY